MDLQNMEKTETEVMVKELKISNRLRNILLRHGILKLSQVRSYSREEILAFRGMGERGMEELAAVCEENGIVLWSIEELPEELRKCRLPIGIASDFYRWGIRESGDLEEITVEEIEVICDGRKDVVRRVGRVLKK